MATVFKLKALPPLKPAKPVVVEYKDRQKKKTVEAKKTEERKGKGFTMPPVAPAKVSKTVTKIVAPIKAKDMPPQEGDDQPVNAENPKGPKWGEVFGRRGTMSGKSIASEGKKGSDPMTAASTVAVPTKGKTSTAKESKANGVKTAVSASSKPAGSSKLPNPVEKPNTPSPIEATPPIKWTMPDGVLMISALSYFARAFLSSDKDAIRHLGMQAEVYGVDIPRYSSPEHIEALMDECFRILTKGKELKNCKGLIPLLTWPGYGGGFIG